VIAEFIDGQTLTQWMIDHPKPDLETVRGIIEQIAKGLQAFHRMEMLHQDLRPDNIMIDRTGTAKIIDFGSTSISGIDDDALEILGTAQYTAPEYFLGEGGTPTSDIFSLGVIAYQMLTGRLPYGAQVAKTRTRAQQRKLKYRSALDSNPELPLWIDGALQKAIHPDPGKRYAELSEVMFDLRHPNKNFIEKAPQPLLQRNPLLFWQVLTAVLAVAVLFLLHRLHTGP
jgi:serine/threonine protein kinase